MSVRVAAGDRDGALRTFQSSWLLVTCASLVALVVVICAVGLTPLVGYLRLSARSGWEAGAIVALLGLYAVLCQQCSILESGYRSDGNFALGTIGLSAIRLFEAAAGTLTAVLTHSLIWAAAAYLAARGLCAVCYGLVLRRKSPWLVLGVEYVCLATIKRLVGPSIGFLLISGSTAVSLQGYTLLIGAVLGPIGVVAFTTLRTMTRLLTLLASCVGWALRPELSAALGADDIALARSLHRNAFRLTVVMAALGGAALALVGPLAYQLWTRRAVAFDGAAFVTLLAVSVVNCLWYTSFAVPTASNKHFRITVTYLAISIGCAVLGWALARPLGLFGAALSLLVCEVCMLCVVLPGALRSLNDGLASFVAAVAAIPAAGATSLSATIRSVGGR